MTRLDFGVDFIFASRIFDRFSQGNSINEPLASAIRHTLHIIFLRVRSACPCKPIAPIQQAQHPK